MILCSRAQEGNSADVDLLDRFLESAVCLCDGGFEGIEVANDDRDGGYGLREEIAYIGWG